MRTSFLIVLLSCLLAMLTLKVEDGRCRSPPPPPLVDVSAACARRRAACAPALLGTATRGAALAAAECAHQFRHRRWNCTAVRRSVRRILLRDTRETAFIHAISSAGVAHSLTRACSAGALAACACERRARDWRWGGCGDDVRWGARKARDVLDARQRRRSDIKAIMRLHNHNAGRLAIKNYMRPECKCHGLSGSCTLKTCWLKMPPFREIGNRLKERFDGAAKVISSNDGNSFIPEGDTIKPPSKQDLVYSEESPDFCRWNHKTGSLGTQGRECDATSAGTEGCDLLCCSRGHRQQVAREEYNCRCSFQWCCNVTCATCVGERQLFTCL